MGKYRCLFLITALCILASCAKEERFSPDGFGPSDMAKGFGHCYNSKVFMVPAPDRDTKDDTKNLLEIIELAQLQGPGSIVQLQKGEYHIGFIEIREFEGTIRGAGMDKTIIKPIPNLPCHIEVEITWDVALVSFIGGNIKMSDLSFDIDEGKPCKEKYSHILGDMGYDLYILVKFVDRVNDHYIPGDLFVSAQLDNISFSGGLDDGGGGTSDKFNVGAGLWFGHDYTTLPAAPDVDRSNGNLIVNNCRFRNLWCGVDLAGLKSGKIIITNNIFRDIDSPLFLFDNINTKGIISGNSFSGSFLHDIYINDMDYAEYFDFYPITTPVVKTTWKISGNYFNTKNFGGSFMNPAGVSIYMLDVRRTMYPERNMAMEFFVNNNTINLQKDAKGIVGFNNIGAMIVSNKFKGTGAVGISLDGEKGIYSSSNKILGNNFSMADYQTDIYLGLLTKNCLVAGSPMAIIDNPGNNNHITGKPK